MKILIAALVTLTSHFALAHGYSSIVCVAETHSGTETTLRIDEDPMGRAMGGELTFALLDGRTNRFTFGSENMQWYSSRAGRAGELYIGADVFGAQGAGELHLSYEGNDFATRLVRGESLFQHFLMLSRRGDFGHVSYNSRVRSQDLGGELRGYAMWHGRRENIQFRNIICARF